MNLLLKTQLPAAQSGFRGSNWKMSTFSLVSLMCFSRFSHKKLSKILGSNLFALTRAYLTLTLKTVFVHETSNFSSLQGCGQLHSGHVDGSPRIAVMFIKQLTEINNRWFKNLCYFDHIHIELY